MLVPARRVPMSSNAARLLSITHAHTHCNTALSLSPANDSALIEMSSVMRSMWERLHSGPPKGPPALDSGVHPNGALQNCLLFAFQPILFWEMRFIVAMLIKIAKLLKRLQT